MNDNDMSTTAAEPLVSFPVDDQDEGSSVVQSNDYESHHLIRDDSDPRFDDAGLPKDTIADPFSFSEDDLIPTQTDWLSARPQLNSYSNFISEPTSQRSFPDPEIDRSVSPPNGRISVSRNRSFSERPPYDYSQEDTSAPTVENQATSSPPKARGISRTLTNLSRKAKVARTASRSPEKQQRIDHVSNELQRAVLNSASKHAEVSEDHKTIGGEKALSLQPESSGSRHGERARKDTLKRSRSLLGRRLRTSSVASSLKNSDASSSTGAAPPKTSPTSPLTKSFSNHHLPAMGHGNRSLPAVPPLTRAVDGENSYPRQDPHVPRKKDDLWGVFRTLDGDFQKFQSKSSAHKAHVVKSSLAPFLRTHAPYASTLRLRPEDLDRRVLILNKWWTALLDLLSGRTNQSLSGVDRPIILDAIVGIMERPEWRTPPSEFAPVMEAQMISASSRARTMESAISNDSDFVLDSVNHSIRNTFVQNLFAQIVLVVDKMSLRHAPASLVAFCGKSCAYAFFFCPGVADMLVRLWDIQLSSLVRIMGACGLNKNTKFTRLSEMIISNFPECLRSLPFTSPREAMMILRKKPILPLGIEKVQWHGYWLNRWSGRDSDLFTVFVKHFHTLAADFLPPSPTKEERLCAPGLIFVHAQILKNLDSTVHRQSNQAAEHVETNISFDDFLGGDENASASALPSFPANAIRLMAENRFVMLLRELSSERSRPYPIASRFISKEFCDILKACVQSTSLFDHNACFVLCDFIQECFPLIAKVQDEESEEDILLDWPFWLNVFRQMLQSQNTTTEIRLYALLFTLWQTITAEPSCRTSLILDLLLTQDHFDRNFCHWCPMVRAYFMRVICWRIARYDGEAKVGDLEILQVLHRRLLQIWSYYKTLAVKADDENTLPPSTAPANPAPGRRLLIIRTDNPAATALSSLNAIVPSIPDTRQSTAQQITRESEASLISPSQLLEKVTSTLEQGLDSTRRRGSIFRSLLGYKNPEPRGRSQSPRPASASEKTSPQGSRSPSSGSSPDRNITRASMYESRPVRPSLQRNESVPKQSSENGQPDQNDQHKAPPAPNPHIPAFFKFSLESVDRRPQSMISDLVLTPPRLPLAAQIFLESQPGFQKDLPASRPSGEAVGYSRYAGRALAEWTLVVNECQNFFERRRNEGVPSNKQVETPTLGVENFRKPG